MFWDILELGLICVIYGDELIIRISALVLEDGDVVNVPSEVAPVIEEPIQFGDVASFVIGEGSVTAPDPGLTLPRVDLVVENLRCDKSVPTF
jgi:hypothetical protein